MVKVGDGDILVLFLVLFSLLLYMFAVFRNKKFLFPESAISVQLHDHCPGHLAWMAAITSQVSLHRPGPSRRFSTTPPEGACYNVSPLLQPSCVLVSENPSLQVHATSPLLPLRLLSSHTGLFSASRSLLHDP